VTSPRRSSSRLSNCRWPIARGKEVALTPLGTSSALLSIQEHCCAQEVRRTDREDAVEETCMKAELTFLSFLLVFVGPLPGTTGHRLQGPFCHIFDVRSTEALDQDQDLGVSSCTLCDSIDDD
jgi:hypothetical protein